MALTLIRLKLADDLRALNFVIAARFEYFLYGPIRTVVNEAITKRLLILVRINAEGLDLAKLLEIGLEFVSCKTMR